MYIYIYIFFVLVFRKTFLARYIVTYQCYTMALDVACKINNTMLIIVNNSKRRPF